MGLAGVDFVKVDLDFEAAFRLPPPETTNDNYLDVQDTTTDNSYETTPQPETTKQIDEEDLLNHKSSDESYNQNLSQTHPDNANNLFPPEPPQRSPDFFRAIVRLADFTNIYF